MVELDNPEPGTVDSPVIETVEERLAKLEEAVKTPPKDAVLVCSNSDQLITLKLRQTS